MLQHMHMLVKQSAGNEEWTIISTKGHLRQGQASRFKRNKGISSTTRMHAVLQQRLLTLLQHSFPELVDLLKFCQDSLVLKGVFVCLSQFPARRLALS